MFNQEEFKDYIKTYIKKDTTYRKANMDNFIDSLCQFEEIPWKFAGYSSHVNFSNYLRKNFNITNKKRSIHARTYFLNNYGYKYCYSCSQIVISTNFRKDSSRPDNLAHKCKVCTNAIDKSRKLLKLPNSPKWLTDTQHKEMADFRDNTPSGNQVDHIVPLRGKYVSGLNVPWNLQYLPTEENRAKSNYHESEKYW